MIRPETSDSDSALGQQALRAWLEWIGFALGAMPIGLWHAYDLLWLQSYTPPGLTKASAFLLTVAALVVHAVGGAAIFAAIGGFGRKGHHLRPRILMLRMILAILAGLFFANGFTIGVTASFPFVNLAGPNLFHLVLGPVIPSLLFVWVTRGRLIQTGPICPQCGYLLYYARDHRCPECGRVFLLHEVDTSNAVVDIEGVLHPRPNDIMPR